MATVAVTAYVVCSASSASLRTCACLGAICAATVCLKRLIEKRRRKRWAAEDHERIRRVAEEHAKRDKRWYAQCGDQPPPAYDTSTDPRFAVTDSAAWLEFLDVHGYAVVRNVADRGEVEEAHDLLWSFLEEHTPMRRSYPDSWTNAAFETIGEAKTGICQGLNVGHSKLCWFLRCLPRVRTVFESIWKTTELVASFDGINIFRPTSDDSSRRTRSGWWHVDQGRFKTGRHAIQGFVALTDATPATGGLCVIPGSHTTHEDLMAYAATNDRDHVRVPSPDINPLCRHPKLVRCLAGDLVLWDSRTVHCNTPALADALEAPSADDAEHPPAARRSDQLLRVAAYVCMLPASTLSAEARDRRRLAFAARIGTTHWPDHFVDAVRLKPCRKSLGAKGVAASVDAASKPCRDLI